MGLYPAGRAGGAVHPRRPGGADGYAAAVVGRANPNSVPAPADAGADTGTSAGPHAYPYPNAHADAAADANASANLAADAAAHTYADAGAGSVFPGSAQPGQLCRG